MLANIVSPVFRENFTVSLRDVAVPMPCYASQHRQSGLQDTVHGQYQGCRRSNAMLANIVSPVFRENFTVSTRDVAVSMPCYASQHRQSGLQSTVHGQLQGCRQSLVFLVGQPRRVRADMSCRDKSGLLPYKLYGLL